MSIKCRICPDKMPEDRLGREQVCPACRKKGYKELTDATYNYYEEKKLKDENNSN